MNGEPKRTAPGRGSRASSILLGLLYAIVLLRLPGAVDATSDDWPPVVAHDLVSGNAFGLDSITTCGPLSPFQVGLPPSSGLSYGALLIIALFTAIAAGFFVGLTFARLQNRLRRAAFTVSLIATALIAPTHSLLIVLCTLFLWLLEEPKNQLEGSLRTILVLAWAAVLACTEFSLFAFSSVSVLLLAGRQLASGSRQHAATTLFTYLAAIALTWTLSGQSLINLPTWIRTAAELSRQTSSGLGQSGYPGQLTFGALSAVALAAACVLSLARSSRSLASLAIIATTLVLTWKRAYVQHDLESASLFFFVGSTLPFVLLAFVPPTAAPLKGTRDRLAFLAAITAIACTLFVGRTREEPDPSRLAMSREVAVDPLELPTALWNAVEANATALLTLAKRREVLAGEIAARRQSGALPRIQELVAGRSIDGLPRVDPLLHLDAIDLHHRPVIESRTAFTPKLQQRNRDFFLSTAAPDFVLWTSAPSGDKYPLMDDAAAHLALLSRYVPRTTEAGHLLLERVAPAPTEAECRELATYDVELGEWTKVPELATGLRALAVEVNFSFAGRVRQAVLRAPTITMQVLRSDGTQREYEITSGSASSGFLISPLVDSTADFARLYAHEELARPVEIRIATKKRHEVAFEPELTLRILEATHLMPEFDEDTRRGFAAIADQVAR